MNIKHLVILSKEYPTVGDPIYTFVDQLACELADQGVGISVIAPQSVTHALAKGKRAKPLRSERLTPGGRSFPVLRPLYASFSNHRGLARITYQSFYRAVLRALRQLDRPDALYGHFISMAGLAASDAGQALGVPAFMAYGESSLKLCAHFERDFLAARLNRLNGVVAVSTKNRDELLEAGLIGDSAKIEVFPNGVDRALFRPLDKREARKKLGLNDEDFVVAFCGYFIERKGIGVLCRALDSAGGMKSIFIGRGEARPDCAGIAFAGSLAHEEIAKYLAAADVFALPTLAEGCCNAIVEALASGLPVVSSDRRFNDDVLDETNSIRIDPTDSGQVADALNRLRGEPALRAALGRGALKKADSLSIECRARNILAFMERKA